MYGKDRGGVGRTILTQESGALFGMSNLTEAAINGRLFYTASQASSTTSTTLNTTHVGLLVGNPAGSGKYVVMHEFGFAADGSISGEGIIGLATGAIGDMALVAAPVIQPALVGGASSSVAYADQVGVTTGTLTCVRVVAQLDDTAAGTAYGFPIQVIDLKGSIVLSPGYLIGTETTVAAGDVMWFHFLWEEIDV